MDIFLIVYKHYTSISHIEHVLLLLVNLQEHLINIKGQQQYNRTQINRLKSCVRASIQSIPERINIIQHVRHSHVRMYNIFLEKKKANAEHAKALHPLHTTFWGCKIHYYVLHGDGFPNRTFQDVYIF